MYNVNFDYNYQWSFNRSFKVTFYAEQFKMDYIAAV